MAANLDTHVTSLHTVSTRPAWASLYPYIGMFVLTLLLWLPFSFKTTGLIEEIGLNELMEKGVQIFFATPDSDLSMVRTRPLQMFNFGLGYILDPNSYAGYNILFLIFTFAKMVITYWLVQRFLPGKKALAFITGILFAIYPADTGLFAFRVIAAHAATVAYLFAVYFLIRFVEQKGRMQWVWLFGIALSLTFSLWQYQIALAACLVTPVVLLYFTRPNKQFWKATGAWYGIIGLLLAYTFWALGQSVVQNHEESLLPQGITPDSIQQMLYALFVGYQRQFTGWAKAVNNVSYFTYYHWYIIIGILVTALTAGWLTRQKQVSLSSNDSVPRWRYALLWLGGVALFAAGVATFIPIPSRQLQELRIYLVAVLGSAWVLALSLYIVSRLAGRHRDTVFLLISMPFVGLALLNAMQLHQQSVNESLKQQNILQQVVAQAPQLERDAKIILLDDYGLMNRDNIYFGRYWEALIRYIYGDQTLTAYYCPPEGGTIIQSNSCDFNTSSFSITIPPRNAASKTDHFNVSYDDLIIFVSGENDSISLLSAAAAQERFKLTGYDPDSLIIKGDPPFRATTYFSCNPALSCYRYMPPVNAIDLDLNQEIGTGWRNPEQIPGSQNVFRWSFNRRSTVDINLTDSSDLSLEFKILSWLDEAVMNSLNLTVNGYDIPLTYTSSETGGRVYNAVIPRTALTGQTRATSFVFTIDRLTPVPDVPTVKLGFMLSEFRIRPVS